MSSKVNRGRTLARSQALQILFQAEALDKPVDAVLAGDYLLSKGPLDDYAIELARGAYEHIDEIDSALVACSKNWDLNRMPASDRNLLRIAVFELRCADPSDRLDTAVVINEAVEIAKAYGTDESAKFVNGILGRIARQDQLPSDATFDASLTLRDDSVDDEDDSDEPIVLDTTDMDD